MFYTFHRIDRQVYEFCVKNKLVDPALIAKWKKAGYERLCSTYVINPQNYKFGTVSICRVPRFSLTEGMEIEDPVTGCRGCASGPGGNKNIFGNKYGQYLAAIQIARENRQEQQDQGEGDDDEEGGEEEMKEAKVAVSEKEEEEEDDDDAPVGAADGSSGVKKAASIWARREEEEELELPEAVIGVLAGEADREGRRAAQHLSTGAGSTTADEGSEKKKQRRG
jgi:hypothetical protein